MSEPNKVLLFLLYNLPFFEFSFDKVVFQVGGRNLPFQSQLLQLAAFVEALQVGVDQEKGNPVRRLVIFIIICFRYDFSN